MAKIGLKYPVFAPLTEAVGGNTYAGGMVMAKAIKASIKINTNKAELRGDDKVIESDVSFKDGKISLEADQLSDAVVVALLAHTTGSVADAAISSNEVLSNSDDTPPYVGFGFYAVEKKDGVKYYRAIWLNKVQFTEPDDEYETKGETLSFKTSTIEGNIYEPQYTTQYRDKALFSTEAGAIAWLNTKAGISTTTPTGLTALSMTGTGGTLSPAFGAAVRSYTFGGVTGASVTVTATASGTLKLYADGTLLQTLISGSPSATIAMSIGSKKLTIIEQEAGKAQQVTDIVVVKTS